MNLGKLLTEGRKALRKEHEEGEKEKLGSLRGGSAGILTPDGEVYGTCPRLAYLRKLGWQEEVEPTLDLMFAAGYHNEDIVALELEKAGCTLKKEEEIPVVWYTDNNTKVSGRPDIAIMNGDKVEMGLELKLISSIWTAKSVLAEEKPKSDHLIQAAHYSWKLEAPWKLVYANRAYWHINYNRFLESAFMNQEMCEHKKGRPFRVIPWYKVYDLTWDGDAFSYKTEEGDVSSPTVITKSGIESYYNAVANLTEESAVPPRPKAKHVDGNKDFNKCDYCSLASVCDNQEGKSLGEWTDHAKLTLIEINKERSL